MRRYDDPVEVRKGMVGRPVEAPEQFLWRGRLWKVRDGARALGGDRAVVAVHRRAGGDRRRRRRRRGPRAGRPPHDLLTEREVWRVEAGRGRSARRRADGGGVFDLSFDWSDGRWQLVGCAD